MIYLAEHPALALLEVRVHLDVPLEDLPDDYVMLRVLLPDEPPGEVLVLPADPVAIGDAWLEGGASVVLRVPSVLVPLRAFNLLLNPVHPRASEAVISERHPFAFDRRLWTGS
jgi:RES domain-containing protein